MSSSTGRDEYEAASEYYDYVIPYRNRPDVAFYVQAAVESGGPVLEIGCGTGRVLIPVARAGIRITGLDSSDSMLAHCRLKLQSEPEAVRSQVELCRADMRTFDLQSTFNFVAMPFRPFQHLITVADQCACLSTVHKHLSNKGRLLVDLFNPSLNALVANDIEQEHTPEPQFTIPDGRKVVRTTRIVRRDLANQVNDVEMIYYVTHPDGRSERIVHGFQMRYLFRFEAEHLLYRCGFRLLEVYSDYDKSPFGSKYPGELILLAERA
jgi:SAM-dependent methyltransferase